MRSLITMASVLVIGAVAAGCDTASDEADSASSDAPSEAATTEAVVPDQPAALTHPVPEGFELDSEGGAQYILGYPSTDTLYRPLDNAESTHRIYVVSYLLPEEYADFEAQSTVVQEYDALSANTAAPNETDPAVTAGYDGVYRHAKVLDWWDEPVEQMNFFVFNGQLMAHVSCQWKNEPEAMLKACQEVATGLSFESPGEGAD